MAMQQDDDILKALDSAGTDDELLNLLDSAGGEEAPAPAAPTVPLDPNYKGPTMSQGTFDPRPEQGPYESPLMRKPSIPVKPLKDEAGYSVGSVPVAPSESQTRAGIMGFMRTYTSEWFDELGARQLANQQMMKDMQEGVQYDDPERQYDSYVEAFRNRLRGLAKTGEEMYPKTTLVGQGAGVVGQVVASPLGALGPGEKATGLTRVAQVAGTGGFMGGLNAAGASEEETPEGVAVDTSMGVAAGAVAAPVLDKGLRMVGGGLQKVANSSAFKALTGKFPGTAAADETAQMSSQYPDAKGAWPEFVDDYLNSQKGKATQMGRDALDTGVVGAGRGTEGMTKAAQKAQAKAAEKMENIGRLVDQGLGDKKGYAMGQPVLDAVDDISKTIAGVEDPVDRKAAQGVLSILKTYADDFSAQGKPQGELFGGVADEGASTFEKAWRVLKRVQERAATTTDPFQKEMLTYFAEAMRQDLVEQTMAQLAQRQAMAFSPAGDKMGGFVAREVGDMVNADAAAAESETAANLLGAIQKPKQGPQSGTNVVSQYANVVPDLIESVTGPRVMGTVASVADKGAKAASIANPAVLTQTARTTETVRDNSSVEKYSRSSYENIKARMQTDPKSLGKFGPYLDKVLREEGEDGLKRKLLILGMTNPEWQQLSANLE